MCQCLEVVLWDLLVVIAIILFVLWILTLTHTILVNTGPLKHLFVAVAACFLLVWIFVRCCNCCRGGRYGKRRTVIV
ncbi:hypothetical protein HKX48_006191 [Thoreauomyces humboldtii]|nr:hypothetical protein HKX48_006191 [Thoreauomyces humboldtii]